MVHLDVIQLLFVIRSFYDQNTTNVKLNEIGQHN